MMETFHERLTRLREAKGWSQAKLAKRSKMRETSIAALETETRRAPEWIAISKLAAALETNPFYLASGEGDDKPFVVPSEYLAETTASNRKW